MQALFRYFSGKSSAKSETEYAVGDKVTTTFGIGSIHQIRADGIYVVKVDNWKLADGKSPTLYLNYSSMKLIKEDKILSHRENIAKAFPLKAGDQVKTIFGQGTVREIRDDKIHVVDLKNWSLANNCKPVCYMNAQSLTLVSVPSSSGAASPIKPISVPVVAPVITKPISASSFKVGDFVSTIFGPGKISTIRSDGIHIVNLFNWELANGCKPVLYMNPSALSKSAGPTDLIVGDKVKCAFGQGFVKSIRHDGIIIVGLDNWNLANNSKPTLYLNPAFVSKAVIPVPAGGFKVGDQVQTIFGKGQILEIRTTDNIHVVTLFKWILANKKSPKLYLNVSSLSLISRSNMINTLYNEALKSNKIQKRLAASAGIIGSSAAGCCIIA